MSKLHPDSQEARDLAAARQSSWEAGRQAGIVEAHRDIGIPAAILTGLRNGSLVAVPREPTEAMNAAGACAYYGTNRDHAAAVYHAMLDAGLDPWTGHPLPTELANAPLREGEDG